MTVRPQFRLSRLRTIGWELWDPIGLKSWENKAEDEYDPYLLVAAERLWNGAAEEEVTHYLLLVETEHMGLAGAPSARRRAQQVVRALSDHVREIRRSIDAGGSSSLPRPQGDSH